MNQTYKKLQIILIDDGSTDRSGEVCDEYVKKDGRFLCIHQENQGVSKARNQGIERAVGDYYHFPDSDDYIEPDTYEYLLNIIKEKKCDVVSFEYFITHSECESKHLLGEEFYGMCNRGEAHEKVIRGVPFACNKIYSKRAIKNVRFSEKIYRGEDSLFVHHVIENIDFMWFDKRPLYHYVQSEESACRGKFRKSQLSAIKLHDEYRKIYEKKYPEIWNLYKAGEIELYIMLYYDMYADGADYTDEMNNLHQISKVRCRELGKEIILSKKRRLKYTLFYTSPKLFCIMHKYMHGL